LSRTSSGSWAAASLADKDDAGAYYVERHSGGGAAVETALEIHRL